MLKPGPKKKEKRRGRPPGQKQALRKALEEALTPDYNRTMQRYQRRRRFSILYNLQCWVEVLDMVCGGLLPTDIADHIQKNRQELVDVDPHKLALIISQYSHEGITPSDKIGWIKPAYQDMLLQQVSHGLQVLCELEDTFVLVKKNMLQVSRLCEGNPAMFRHFLPLVDASEKILAQYLKTQVELGLVSGKQEAAPTTTINVGVVSGQTGSEVTELKTSVERVVGSPKKVMSVIGMFKRMLVVAGKEEGTEEDEELTSEEQEAVLQDAESIPSG